MYTFCCLIWKRDFSASYTCFVVEVPSLVLARRRRKIFERTLDFLHSRNRKQFCFLGGSKWCHIYTFFTQPAADEKNFVFFWVKMVAYILHTHFFTQPAAGEKIRGFWVSKWCHIYTFWTMFLCQNATICTYFGRVFGVKNAAIYTFLEFNFFRKNEKKKKQYARWGSGETPEGRTQSNVPQP